ncbi:Dehydrogenase kinase [Phaffia rhodozyma]|uniref:Protein-serine/threonine kinase n=1 Tax=Phaffia rhodozyma TaxID=264483 RepID=A0A0F7SRL3_PHARH|nr:Dehydrogenase kinase [Phaffia rhodozyma]
MAWKIPPSTYDKINHFAGFAPTAVSLQQMIRFGQNPSQGTLLKASQFLAEELPIRLSHRVKELDELPENLNKMPSINRVKEWYAQSFEELVSFPPPQLPEDIQDALRVKAPTPLPEATDNPSLESHYYRSSQPDKGKMRIPLDKRYYGSTKDIIWPPEVHDYNDRFTKCLQKIKARHDPTVMTVARGILEWKHSKKSDRIGLSIQQFLDRFHMSRIGIRFLIGQHIALNTLPPHPEYVGIICKQANIFDMCTESIENAKFVASDHYCLFKAPEVQLVCPEDLAFPYVPGHLAHIIFELLKNSLRATIERFGADHPGEYPPIKVVVVEGKEDITIKISDEGGGIPRSAIPLIWTYMYTTMEAATLDDVTSDFNAPMAGFGYGLPLSRLYARFFGGDLRLISMEGYGTDVYIHLNRLGESKEPLQ